MNSLISPDSESSDSIMTLSSDNESVDGNNTDISAESCIEPYNPSQKVRFFIKSFPIWILEKVNEELIMVMHCLIKKMLKSNFRIPVFKMEMDVKTT